MPFKSQAQRRKFAQLLVEGKISNQTFEDPAIGFVYHLEQILVALFFDVFVDLIGHFRGGSIAPW